MSRRAKSCASSTPGAAWTTNFLVAGRGFALGAGQCIVFLGDGVQVDGEVFAHWQKPLRHTLSGRGPHHHPVAVLHRQAHQAVAYCAAHQVSLQAGSLGGDIRWRACLARRTHDPICDGVAVSAWGLPHAL